MLDHDEIKKLVLELLEQDLGNPSNLEELETHLLKILHQTGQQVLTRCLQSAEKQIPDEFTKCGWCGKDAKYVSKRIGFVSTQFGLIRYWRAYYVCPHCHRSTCPLDERLDPYTSLAKLRTQIAAGKSLPVDELAKSWGLGSLKYANEVNLISEASSLENPNQSIIDSINYLPAQIFPTAN
jgi:hypothetical protein